MILADKIIKLRKQFGWSQEELAEKMNVSRQSVSKWESTNSIPDLNKIILLAGIFGVSTDYLVKDEVEEIESISEDKEPNIVRITLEEAVEYVDRKVEMSKLISKGVFLCIFSVVPLFFLLAMAEGAYMKLTANTSTALGLVLLFVCVSAGVSLFIRSNQYETEIARLEKEEFELVYGVRSIFKEKMKNFRGVYNQRVSISVTMFIISVVPLILVALLLDSGVLVLLMLVVLLLIVGTGIYLIIPATTQYTAYNYIIGESDYSNSRKYDTNRVKKLGAFYLPLVTAIYIGWSLWTMAWGITWIIWPVASIGFAALIGLIELFDSSSKNR